MTPVGGKLHAKSLGPLVFWTCRWQNTCGKIKGNQGKQGLTTGQINRNAWASGRPAGLLTPIRRKSKPSCCNHALAEGKQSKLTQTHTKHDHPMQHTSWWKEVEGIGRSLLTQLLFLIFCACKKLFAILQHPQHTRFHRMFVVVVVERSRRYRQNSACCAYHGRLL